MLPVHIPGEIPPPIDVRLAVALLAGLLATLTMSVVMRWQSYGYVPAYVAAGAVFRQPPEEVSWSAANAIHLAAGMLAGLAFESLVIAYEQIREPLGITVEVVIVGVTTLSELLALVVVVAFLYGFFVGVVFPRFGGIAHEVRPAVIRRQWALAVFVYGCGLFAAFKLVYTVLPI